jgi:hypothetical protein
MDTALLIAVFGFAIVSYLLPWVISEVRNAQHGTAILLINIFLGWTVLGWFAALIWAVVEKPVEAKPSSPPPPPVHTDTEPGPMVSDKPSAPWKSGPIYWD